MRIWFLLSAIPTTRHYSEVVSGPTTLTQLIRQLRGDECFGRFCCNDLCPVATLRQRLDVPTIQLVNLPSFAGGYLVLQRDKMELHKLSDFVRDVPIFLELPVHDAMLYSRTREFNRIVQGLDDRFQVFH